MEKSELSRSLREGLDPETFYADIDDVLLEDRKKLAVEFYTEFKDKISKSMLLARLTLCGPDALADCIDDGTIPVGLFGSAHPEKVAENFRKLYEDHMENKRRKARLKAFE